MLTAILFTVCLLVGVGLFIYQVWGRFNLLRAATGRFTLDRIAERLWAVVTIALGQKEFIGPEVSWVRRRGGVGAALEARRAPAARGDGPGLRGDGGRRGVVGAQSLRARHAELPAARQALPRHHLVAERLLPEARAARRALQAGPRERHQLRHLAHRPVHLEAGA